MANVEISDLLNKATPLSTDEFEIQATVGGASNKVTLANMAANMPAITTVGATITSVAPSLLFDETDVADKNVRLILNGADWIIQSLSDAGGFQANLLVFDDSTSTWDFQANDIITTGAVTCAAFTSTGIDDNATGERLEVGDLSTVFGPASSTAQYSITQNNTDALLTVSGGSTAGLGANIRLFSEAHSTSAGDVDIRSSLTTTLRYDLSATEWDFQANDIITTGDTTAAGLTLTGLLKKSVTDTITAGATQTQAGATALTTDINRVTVVATASDGVKLPTAVAGLEILIVNDDSTDALQVWPDTGDAIDGGAANAVDANTLAAGSARRYITTDATNWFTA